MFDKSCFEQFNQGFSALISGTCKVPDLGALEPRHVGKVRAIFNSLFQQNINCAVEEWGIEPNWLFQANKFAHDPSDHVHSEINPFGMKLLRDKDSSYVICPHVHIENEIIGGDSIVEALQEIALGMASDRLDYVLAKHANKIWQKTTEVIMTRTNFVLSNEDWTDNMTTSKKAQNETLAPEEKGKVALEADASVDGYNPERLDKDKYNKTMEDANVGEVMSAFGEALDEVLNRRDTKPREKEARIFLSISDADMSSGDKTYPGFYTPMALMALEATLEQQFNVHKSVNYNWMGQVKPLAFGMYEIGLNTEKRMMNGCYQYCSKKDDPNQKVVIVREIEHTMSGPVLVIRCMTDVKDIDIYNNLFKDIKQWMQDNNYYRGKKIAADGKFLNVGKYSWDDVVLEPDVKDNVFDDVVGFLNYADLYRVNDLPFKRGLILYGKPGCGKTLLGKVVANQVKSSFIWVTAAQASSAGFIRELFSLAREISPSVLFFEDIDMYTVDRGYGAFNSLVGEMLAQMDGMEENDGLVVVATTNRLDVIEKALAERPSRFDRRYSLDYISPETTEKMVSQKMGNAILVDVTPREVAEMVLGLNGCFIQEVIVSAKRKAISRGQTNDAGIATLYRDTLQESTDEVVEAFKIALDRLRNGDMSGFGISARPAGLNSGEKTYNSPVMMAKSKVSEQENVREPVTMATARTPRNVNLTHPEKQEMDTEIKDALSALAKFSEHDDESEIEDYLSEERLNDHAVAVTGSVFDEVDWDNLERPDLRKMFRLMFIRHNVVRIAGKGKDPLKDRKVLGNVLHAMDMLSDRYYWVHAMKRIGQEFGLKIEIPFNPYRDQTSKDAALKLYDMLTGKVKSAKELEDAVNRKNNVFVPAVEDYDLPDFENNDPKIDNKNKPELMKK